jgi:nucleotide-binding universal stress UspA family protein
MAEPDEWTDNTVRREPVRPILVALDFSAVSRHALAWALQYSAQTGCAVHTIHVVDRRLHRGDLSADSSALRNELAQIHAEAAAELKRQVDDDLRKAVLLHEHISIGPPAAEILSVALEIDAGHIIVGSHGRGAIERLLIGSTAERVVRGARCTVVVVREPAPVKS